MPREQEPLVFISRREGLEADGLQARRLALPRTRETEVLEADGKAGGLAYAVLALFAAGLSATQLLEELPDLEPEDLQASLSFAAGYLDHPVLVV